MEDSEEDGESSSEADGESSSEEDGEESAEMEDDSEHPTNRAESDLKLLRKVVVLWERIKSGTQTLRDAEAEELDVAKRGQCISLCNIRSLCNISMFMYSKNAIYTR